MSILDQKNLGLFRNCLFPSKVWNFMKIMIKEQLKCLKSSKTSFYAVVHNIQSFLSKKGSKSIRFFFGTEEVLFNNVTKQHSYANSQ